MTAVADRGGKLATLPHPVVEQLFNYNNTKTQLEKNAYTVVN